MCVCDFLFTFITLKTTTYYIIIIIPLTITSIISNIVLIKHEEFNHI